MKKLVPLTAIALVTTTAVAFGQAQDQKNTPPLTSPPSGQINMGAQQKAQSRHDQQPATRSAQQGQAQPGAQNTPRQVLPGGQPSTPRPNNPAPQQGQSESSRPSTGVQQEIGAQQKNPSQQQQSQQPSPPPQQTQQPSPQQSQQPSPSQQQQTQQQSAPQLNQPQQAQRPSPSPQQGQQPTAAQGSQQERARTEQGQARAQPGQTQPNTRGVEQGQTRPSAEQGRTSQHRQTRQTEQNQNVQQGQRSTAQGTERSDRRGTQAGQNLQQDRQARERAPQGEAQTQATHQAGTAVSLNQEQQSRVTGALSTHIGKQRVQPLTRVNFSLSVGTKVPDDVRIYPLPDDVVAIVPQYRAYSYFVVQDQVVIVNPVSKEIVILLPYSGGTQRASTGTSSRSSSRSQLSTEQRSTIREQATEQRPRTRHQVGEAVSGEVDVYRERPAIRSRRYAPVDEDAVVVEPRRRTIFDFLGGLIP